MTSSATNNSELLSIEDLHERACLHGNSTYPDPATGFTVFTELAHLKRGVCCGNVCRHCPYGWENATAARRNANTNPGGLAPGSCSLVASGDTGAIAARLAQHKIRRTRARQQAVPLRQIGGADNQTSTKNGVAKTGGRHGGRLTRKNVPYTRTGDAGTTQLLTGERRRKDNVLLETMGTVDELCAVVGVCYETTTTIGDSSSKSSDTMVQLREWLLEIMSRLFDIGSHVAKPRSRRRREDESDDDTDEETGFVADGVGGGFDEAHVLALEDCIDQLTEELPELSSFLLPTGPAAYFHVGRTVCRRAERCMVSLQYGDEADTGGVGNVIDPNCVMYVNRLSDFLFTAGRYVNWSQGHGEVLYRRPTRGSKQRTRVTASTKKDER